MSIIDQLITDRTQADVDRQLELNARWVPDRNYFAGTTEERDEWLQGTKGTYSADDLNRVCEAIQYVAGRLQAAGYAVSVTARTGWTDADWATPSVLRGILKDLKSIRSSFAQARVLPDVPGYTDRLTYTMANDMEQILRAADELLTNLIAARFYSGDIFSGEV